MSKCTYGNLRFLIFGLLVALSACAETEVSDVDAMDPYESFMGADGKADRYGITDEMPEAEAVIRLANEATFEMLDHRQHIGLDVRAARNIVEYRQAKPIETLAELDSIRWVGRVAFSKLLQYAIDNNLVQRREIDCADYFWTRDGNFHINSYRDLLDFRDSRCTHVHGTVIIKISGTEVIPPQHRDLRLLEHLTSIRGSLQVEFTGHFHTIHFPSLEYASHINLQGQGTEAAHFGALHYGYNIVADAMSILDMPALQENFEIQTTHVNQITVPSLQVSEKIYINYAQAAEFDGLLGVDVLTLFEVDAMKFPRLWTVDSMIYQVGRRTGVVRSIEFPALQTAKTLEFKVADQSVQGSFDSLTSVDTLRAYGSALGGTYNVSFPALTSITTILHTERTVGFYQGLDALESAKAVSSFEDSADGIFQGLTGLRTAETIELLGTNVSGFNSLETVDWIYAEGVITRLEGFNNLRQARKISFHTESPARISGFNSLVEVEELVLFDGEVRDGFQALERANKMELRLRHLSGFQSLEEVETLSLRLSSISNPDGFQNLRKVTGKLTIENMPTRPNFRFDSLEYVRSLEMSMVRYRVSGRDSFGGEGLMPNLEIIDGNALITNTPQVLSGFDNLALISGTLNIQGHLESLQGMGSLEYILRNIIVPRSFAGDELDQLLLQLVEFEGTVRYH